MRGGKKKLLTLVAEDDNYFDQSLFNNLKSMMEFFGGDISQVSKAQAICNPDLLKVFETCNLSITGRHESAKSKFKQDDWRKKDDGQLRKSYLNNLAAKIRKTRDPFNEGDQVIVFFYFFYFFIFLFFYFFIFLFYFILFVF